MTTWIYTAANTNASTAAIPVNVTWPGGVGQGGGGGVSVSWPQPAKPKPEPASPLEWLDAEVEKTCAIARGGGR